MSRIRPTDTDEDRCYFRHTTPPSDPLPHLLKSQQLQNTTDTETQACKIQQLGQLNKKIKRPFKAKYIPLFADRKNLL